MTNFNSSDDWEQPRKQYMDDILVHDPVLGEVPFWKCLLFNSANMREAVMRADAIIEKQRKHEDQNTKPSGPEEDKPPPLIADSAKRVDDELIAKIEKAVDALTERLDALEKGREIDAALNDLEEAMEKEEVPLPNGSSIKH